MKTCNCSDRPLIIMTSKTVMRDGVPYEKLEFACSNKGCRQYHKPVVAQYINLLDRKTTIEEEI